MKNKDIVLQIESVGFEGISIARNEGLVYMLKGGIPGDKVQVRENKRKRKYVEASIKKIVEPSVYRVQPACKHFGVCGGCTWQNLQYEQQLYWKRQHIIDSFNHIANLEPEEICETLPSPEIYYYRNKMEFSSGTSRWLTDEEIREGTEITNKSFAFGLHIPGRYDKVLDIEECHLIDKRAIDILNDARIKALEQNVRPFDDRTGNGFLKNLVIRIVNSGDTMVILITNEIRNYFDQNYIDWLFDDLKIKYNITSMVHAVNSSVSPVAIGKINRIEGEQYLIEEIDGSRFKISPYSFFQTNSKQLPGFIDSILKIAEISPNEILWDLYCGTGVISILASRKAKSVIGIELSEDAINDAKDNARLNNSVNAEFLCYDLNSKDSYKFLMNLPNCDLIIIDPPRSGVHKNLIESILKIAPERIIYVSCNPTTQARDCSLLSEKYTVKKIQPVDMFPHTYHIESIAQLIRN